MSKPTTAAPSIPPILGPGCCNVFCGRRTFTMYYLEGHGPYCAICAENINWAAALSVLEGKEK